MKQIILFSFALLLGFSGCKNAQETTEVETVYSLPSAIVSMDWSTYTNDASTQIESVIISGNKISIAVQYSGGCNEHEFNLVGHKMVSKSLPPIRSIKLFHNSNGESCRELVNEVLVFDISSFAFGDDEITLKLEGYDKPLSYIPLR